MPETTYVRSTLKPISKKQAAKKRQEAKVVKQLRIRCKGLCEICGQRPDWRGLHPHEKIFRSHGGEVALENSVMACGRCHSKKHGVKEV